jgi:hypothetical protein
MCKVEEKMLVITAYNTYLEKWHKASNSLVLEIKTASKWEPDDTEQTNRLHAQHINHTGQSKTGTQPV